MLSMFPNAETPKRQTPVMVTFIGWLFRRLTLLDALKLVPTGLRPSATNGVLVVLILLLAACGSSAGPASNNGPDLITPGVLTVGSDTTYPPQEYIDTTTRQAAGFDVDLISAIAKLMGLQATIVPTKFATIIDDLVAKRFDVVISPVPIPAERQTKVDFVPYLHAGE